MRNAIVDYCRFVAALGIVWFHTNALGHRIAYMALPFFIVLLSMPSQSSLKFRARRLLVPYVVWSIIYASVMIAGALYGGAEPFAWWQPNMILVGTSIQLWFLPFAFIVTLCTPILRNSKVTPWLPVFAALLLSSLTEPLQVPFAQWSFGLIPALFGIAYFQSGRNAVLAFIASVAVLMALRPSPDNITILTGCALAGIALSFERESSRLSMWCARASVWIYLGHALVLMAGYYIRLEGYALANFCLVGSVLLAACIDHALWTLRARRTRILA